MGHSKTKREVIDIVKRTVKKKMENKGKDFDSCKFKLKGRDGGKGLYEDSFNYPYVRLMAYLDVGLML